MNLVFYFLPPKAKLYQLNFNDKAFLCLKITLFRHAHKANITFKPDYQNQILLFPNRLDKNIPSVHPVHIVNEVVDKLSINGLLSEYKANSTNVYHPRKLLKILIYNYLNNIHSSRKIAQELKKNITF